VADLDPERVGAAVRELDPKRKGTALGVAMDVTDEAAVARGMQ
jgi:hypothetical protein